MICCCFWTPLPRTDESIRLSHWWMWPQYRNAPPPLFEFCQKEESRRVFGCVWLPMFVLCVIEKGQPIVYTPQKRYITMRQIYARTYPVEFISFFRQWEMHIVDDLFSFLSSIKPSVLKWLRFWAVSGSPRLIRLQVASITKCWFCRFRRYLILNIMSPFLRPYRSYKVIYMIPDDFIL